MDLVSASIAGGLIYDIFKMGVTEYETCVKVALKDYVLTEEEHQLIAQDLEVTTENDFSSKENLEKFFETKAPNTQKIVNKYQTQNNITHNGSGNITVGDKEVHGDEIGRDKIEKQVNNYQATPEEILKKL